MQGDVVTAARWLGGSMVLASTILAVGLIRQPGRSPAADPSPAGSAPIPKLEISTPSTSVPRIPVLDPAEGSCPSCLDPPTEAEVWAKRAEARSQDPFWVDAPYPNARILVEKIGEKVDPCKEYPLAGPAQLVHCYYKCTVVCSGREDVVFLDKEHLRRCPDPVSASSGH